MSRTHQRYLTTAAVSAAALALAGLAGLPASAASQHGSQPDQRVLDQVLGIPAGLGQAIAHSIPGGVGAVLPGKGGYQQIAELVGKDTVADDFFGISVSVSRNGKSAVVGACYKGGDEGAAYVFKANKKGTWKQTGELTASDASGSDTLGQSVAISADGQTAVVGAPGHGSEAGAVYVYSLVSGSWTQTAELTASDGVTYDELGQSVAVSADGSSVAAGAPGRSDYTGAAYVFGDSSGSWTQTAEITAKDGVEDAGLGQGIALSAKGTILSVSAPYQGNGAAYVFKANKKGAWKQKAEVTASDGVAGDNYGVSLSMSASGSTILVGSNFHGVAGAAYVYTKSGTTWTQSAELTSTNGVSGDLFGRSVAMSSDGTHAVIGCDGCNDSAGSVYVFALNKKKGSWKQTSEVTASDGAADDYLGVSVAAAPHASTMVGGAFGHDDLAGTAYVFAS